MGDEIGHLFVIDLETSQLEALIQRVAAERGYRYAHCYEDIHFDFDFPVGFSVGKWQCGRVFCDAFEIRWKQKHNGFGVCLLGESQIPRWLEEQVWDWRRKAFQTQPTQHVLVGGYLPVKGECQTGFFTATRVPHQLRYPYPTEGLQRQEQLQLTGVRYVSQGVVSYIRYRRLEKYEQPE